MPEVQRKKDMFDLSKGLNTVSSEITFPDGFTSDELNYTIEPDGSRKRRRGLDEEAGGSTKTVVAIATGQYNQSFKWSDAGADPDYDLYVHQIGYTLYISNDAETISTTYNAAAIDLSNSNRKVASATTAATIGGEPCSFAVHRGYLVVTNKYLKPFYVTIDPTDDSITVTTIDVTVRDFEGVDDGIGIAAEPTAASTGHTYNIHNRGWKGADITSFFTALGKYPAKNSLWYKGYKRTYALNIYEADGARSWDNTKMDAEVFGNSSAPQGSLFINILDTVTATSAEGGGVETAISSWTYADETSAESLTITFADNHGWATPADDGVEINISGQSGTYNVTGSGIDYEFNDLNGTYTLQSATPTTFGQAKVTGVNTIAFWVPAVDSNFDVWVSQYSQRGQLDGGAVLENPDGSVLTVGPSVCEAWSGRIWYGGVDDQEWADTVFFSRISRKPGTFGYCYQEADPTDEFINQIRQSDGGAIVVPGLGNLKQMKNTRYGLLLFSDNGVWEIVGGRGGFTADNYLVRKISEAECNAPLSVTVFDGGIVYTGPKGITVLAPNQYTGQLEPVSISDQTIAPTWNGITDANQVRVQSAYDDAKKRLYFIYRDSATLSHTYDKALVYDMRNQAWYPLGFNYAAAKGIISIFSISAADSSESDQKMKFQCEQTTTTVETCDMDQTDYIDFDQTESPLPYLVTGWDPMGDHQRRGQAPIITVFNKRTGTGWTDAGGGDWSEDNVGSTLMTSFWDWTDTTEWDSYTTPTAQQPWSAQTDNYGITGKIQKQVETYRHTRAFTPLATSDVDGYPVLATRHKVRGRGRVLSMRFDGAALKDSHLLGFTVNQKITRKK
jgi:hypothetical protein